MIKDILEKIIESAQAVFPIFIIVLLLHFTIAPMPVWTFILFLVGTFLLIIGLSIFSMGADMAMMPIGEAVGAELTKSKKLWMIIVGAFILGFIVTIAEPDLQVLTKQVPAVPDMTLVLSVAVGVGVFLVLALLRILFQIPIHYLFVVSYGLVFILAAFVGPDFMAIGFDSGGVTTGPITVPFILSLGVGISAVRYGKTSEEDSFGLCALCSIGPIIAVLIMGIFFDVTASGHAFETSGDINSLGQLFFEYKSGFFQFLKEAVLVLLPILFIFLMLQITRFKMARNRLIRILIGILYTLVGLTIFLTGANVGFMPAGAYIGKHIASMPNPWILYPLSAVLGFFIVYAEPAVHMLNNQVEHITSGAISEKLMMAGISIGVSMALLLSIIRIIMQINIWYFLVPGYLIALVLTFYAPKIFTAIAFDSGGVAAGTMSAVFLLPFAVGICEATGGNVMTEAFGIVAMVAMIPIITIQVLGITYDIKLKRNQNRENPDNTIISEIELSETYEKDSQ